jgi:hypothetical protein
MIHVTLYFAPENVPIALEACRALFTEAWKEPQLDFCQIVQSAEEPGVIRIQEAWNVTRKYLDEVGNWISLENELYFPLENRMRDIDGLNC